MPKPASSVADEVVSRARGLDLYVTRMERLYAQGSIPRSDIERVYAGGFLAFYAYLERAIERLSAGLLTGRLISQDSQVRPLIKVKSDRVAYAVLRGERSYANWFPYEKYTIRRAKAFFAGGKPFTRLTRSQIKAFHRATVIRNALAHQSSAALRRFRETFTAGIPLPPDQRRPAGYLRGQHTIRQTRFNLLLSEIVGTMRVLAK